VQGFTQALYDLAVYGSINVRFTYIAEMGIAFTERKASSDFTPWIVREFAKDYRDTESK
jgi:hypothetical protein